MAARARARDGGEGWPGAGRRAGDGPLRPAGVVRAGLPVAGLCVLLDVAALHGYLGAALASLGMGAAAGAVAWRLAHGRAGARPVVPATGRSIRSAPIAEPASRRP